MKEYTRILYKECIQLLQASTYISRYKRCSEVGFFYFLGFVFLIFDT